MKLTKQMIKEFEDSQTSDGTRFALIQFLDEVQERVTERLEGYVSDVVFEEMNIE